MTLLFAVTTASIAFGTGVSTPLEVDGVLCSDIDELGIRMQDNLRAGLILLGCGVIPANDAMFDDATTEAISPLDYAYVDVDLITSKEHLPKVTQSESMVWANGRTIVVHYNDSTTAPQNFSGISVSLDEGATFIRLLPAPLANGHGRNYGDPIVFFNQALQMWFAGDLVQGCGGQGIGLWTSPDGLNWTPGACVHSGGSDDRESASVDNNPESATFGRMYITWNDFGYQRGRAIYGAFSDDGTNWSTPVRISPTFIRNVQLTVPPDGDSTVFLAGMYEGDEGPMRANLIYRSSDGGNTWQTVYSGSLFRGPGRPGCVYFSRIEPIWRHMGWGQPAAGPHGHIHYAYTGWGLNGPDQGDIFYIRSTDNGETWSVPIVLNTDQASGGTREQWMPSVSTTEDGSVFVAWYDRRDTLDGLSYAYWGRESSNGGDTWSGDGPISDLMIPQPTQPDNAMASCYAGDYNYHSTVGSTHLLTWTDGRNQVQGVPQQDVYFKRIEHLNPRIWHR